MNKFALSFLAAALVCAPAACFGLQDKNPNQQQQQATPKNQPPPGASSGQTSQDVPNEKPGTNNPDISPDSKPAATTDTARKKSKRRKRSSTSTHTAPTS
jgi:hypothetical protein